MRGKGISTWEVSSLEKGTLLLRKDFSFRTQKRIVEFIQAVLELSREFLINPLMTIRFPNLRLEIEVGERDKERGEIFAMAIEDIYFKLESH